MRLLNSLFIITAFTFLIIGCKQPPIKKNDWDVYKLKGKVKSMIEIDYYTNRKDTVTNKNFMQSKRIEFFDSNGFLEEIQYFNSYNHLEISEKQLFKTVSNTTTYEDSLFLFGQKKLTNKSISIKTLDENGNNIVDSGFDGYGNLKGVTKTIYENFGNILEQFRYDEYGKLVLNERHEFECDAKGRIIKYKGYNSNGILEDKAVVTYD